MAISILGVPGPSPWYLPLHSQVVDGFQWQSAGKDALTSGKTVLMGPKGAVAILNLYNYVLPLGDSKMLVWHQATPSSVHFLLIDPAKLPSLGSDLADAYAEMNIEKDPIKLGSPALADFFLSTSNITCELKAIFPQQLSSINELLILCRSPGIECGNGF